MLAVKIFVHITLWSGLNCQNDLPAVSWRRLECLLELGWYVEWTGTGEVKMVSMDSFHDVVSVGSVNESFTVGMDEKCFALKVDI